MSSCASSWCSSLHCGMFLYFYISPGPQTYFYISPAPLLALCAFLVFFFCLKKRKESRSGQPSSITARLDLLTLGRPSFPSEPAVLPSLPLLSTLEPRAGPSCSNPNPCSSSSSLARSSHSKSKGHGHTWPPWPPRPSLPPIKGQPRASLGFLLLLLSPPRRRHG